MISTNRPHHGLCRYCQLAVWFLARSFSVIKKSCRHGNQLLPGLSNVHCSSKMQVLTSTSTAHITRTKKGSQEGRKETKEAILVSIHALWATMNLEITNVIGPSIMLLFEPVLFLIWHVKMSAAKVCCKIHFQWQTFWHGMLLNWQKNVF